MISLSANRNETQIWRHKLTQLHLFKRWFMSLSLLNVNYTYSLQLLSGMISIDSYMQSTFLMNRYKNGILQLKQNNFFFKYSFEIIYFNVKLRIYVKICLFVSKPNQDKTPIKFSSLYIDRLLLSIGARRIFSSTIADTSWHAKATFFLHVPSQNFEIIQYRFQFRNWLSTQRDWENLCNLVYRSRLLRNFLPD